MIHGGRLVAEALAEQGVTHVFTLCGGHIQHIYDGCLDVGIRVVDVRHEQTAAHAADAWSRITGTCGVALVTAGPGVTNAVTAVANAQAANVPMLLIGGAGPRQNQHQGSLQDMNHLDLMRSITKWSASVQETRRLPEFVRMAVRKAMTGVPGPVFLEIPLDVLMTPTAAFSRQEHPAYCSEKPHASPAAVSSILRALEKAERPVVIAGSPLRFASSKTALRDFVCQNEVPTFLSGMARGLLPHDCASWFRHVRKLALSESDLVLVLGTPFDFRLSYGRAIPSTTKVIQVDAHAEMLMHNRSVELAVHADPGAVLTQLSEQPPASPRTSWLTRLRLAETDAEDAMRKDYGPVDAPVHPAQLCEILRPFLRDDAIVIGDGGDFVATAAYALKVGAPGTWLDPGPLGTLGVGPGFAMAAQLAHPEAQVVILFGDGAVGFHIAEFEALARQGIPVVGIIGNDGAWSQIRRGQISLFGEQRAVATGLDMTRYDLVAEALGAKGYFAPTQGDLAGCLRDAFSCGKPALINVVLADSTFRQNALSV